MKNVLILHGAGNNSTGNWFSWLKRVLEEKGWEVWSPDLPNSDTPDQDIWTNFIFANKDWKFNEESIIVGHSAGATLILRLLEKLAESSRINKAIPVAPYANKGTLPQYFKYKVNMLKTPFNWDKIKGSCKEFIFVVSDNDKYQCGIDQSKTLQEHLGGNLALKSNQGHFNLEVGEKYKEFPELLKYI